MTNLGLYSGIYTSKAFVQVWMSYFQHLNELSNIDLHTRIHKRNILSLPPTQTQLSDSTTAHKAQKTHACKHKRLNHSLAQKLT